MSLERWPLFSRKSHHCPLSGIPWKGNAVHKGGCYSVDVNVKIKTERWSASNQVFSFSFAVKEIDKHFAWFISHYTAHLVHDSSTDWTCWKNSLTWELLQIACSHGRRTLLSPCKLRTILFYLFSTSPPHNIRCYVGKNATTNQTAKAMSYTFSLTRTYGP